MIKNRLYRLLVIGFLVMAVQAAMGSFIGSEDRTKDKYSLKNLPAISKNYSFSSLCYSSFRYLGSTQLTQQINANKIEFNSIIRLQNGNTTYVYPYKYVIKVPKFKTPTPPKP